MDELLLVVLIHWFEESRLRYINGSCPSLGMLRGKGQ